MLTDMQNFPFQMTGFSLSAKPESQQFRFWYDDITLVSELSLSVTSSDTSIASLENIKFGGSGEERTVTIFPAPNQTGSSTITITVTDEANNTSYESFLFSVSEFNEWEWQLPKPQGSWLGSVWGTSKNNVYAVGAGGTILHYDGIT